MQARDRRGRLAALSALLVIATISWLGISSGLDLLPGPRAGLPPVPDGGSDRLEVGLVPECGPPAEASEELYGPVTDGELPWTPKPPPELVKLREQHNAPRLVAAFRTTLPDPLFEEAYNITRAATLLQGAVVAPGDIFSVNSRIGPYTTERGYRPGPTYVGTQVVPSIGGGVCKISSTMYNVSWLADVEIVERHQHSMQVPYVPAGRDATLVYGALDFRFRNQREAPIVIWSDTEDGTLYMAFYSDYEPPRQVIWEHQELGRQPMQTVRRPNPELSPGEERTIIAGADGVTVHTWVTVEYADQPPRRNDLGIDTYRPMPRVVEFGP